VTRLAERTRAHAGLVTTRLTSLAGSPASPAHRNRPPSTARALARSYGHDEREALALLILPFLLVASAIVLHQTMRDLNAYLTLASIATPDTEIAPLRPTLAAHGPAERLPPASAREAIAPRTALAAVSEAPGLAPAPARPITLPPQMHAGRAAPPATLAPPLPAIPPATRIGALALPDALPPQHRPALARLAPAAGIDRDASAVAPGHVAVMDTGEDGLPIRSGICSTADAARMITTGALASSAPLTPERGPAATGEESFGLALARAAETQVGQFVIYNDAYRRIGYPMGDVNGLFGVCSDVVIRAYRSLGIDLQALVHQARAGSGDTNIDHRRTEVLRRFFAAHGESLPISSFAEDYRPGDLVTYYRPQNQRSRAHIAIVSSVTAPSGRPMIVHNRGWGPQLEDALFVDQITGHYRYRGTAPTRQASAIALPVRKPGSRAAAASPAALTITLPLPGR